MPVPKRKRSKARRDSRFANKGLKPESFSLCSQCTAPVLPHVVCKECGFYKGVKIMRTKLDRLGKRVEVRKAYAQEQQAMQAKSDEGSPSAAE